MKVIELWSCSSVSYELICLCMHCRFYSNNSNFVHGSMDGRPDEQQTVTGQAVSTYLLHHTHTV